MIKGALRLKLLQWSGWLSIKWSQRPNGIYCFNYHRIGNPETEPFDPNVFSASTEQFEQQLIFYKNNFKVISVDDLVNMVKNNKPVDNRYAVITFDDGYLDNFTNAYPLLKKHNLSAAFYIPTNYIETPQIPWWDEVAWLIQNTKVDRIKLAHWKSTIDLKGGTKASKINEALKIIKLDTSFSMKEKLCQLRQVTQIQMPSDIATKSIFMSWAQLREMSQNNMHIGSHTCSHNILSHLSEKDQIDEIFNSKIKLERKLQKEITTLAYPVGSEHTFNDITIQTTKNAGYTLAFSYIKGVIYSTSIVHRFCLRRLPIDNNSSINGIKYIVITSEFIKGLLNTHLSRKKPLLNSRNVVSVTRCGSPEEITPYITHNIPAETYFYKYSALGNSLDYKNSSITFREKNTDEFVGFCGAAPVRVLLNSKEITAFWTCDLYLKQEYRGQGLGNYLYDNIEKDQPLLLGLGTSDLAYPIKIKRGWISSDNIKEFFFRRKSNTVKQLLLKIRCSTSKAIQSQNADNKYYYNLANSLELNKIDDLWQSIKQEYSDIAIRDASYINWRYLCSPATQCYQYITVSKHKNGAYKSILVLRETKNRLKIVDYIGPVNNLSVKARLIKEVFELFPKKELYQCIASCQSWHKTLHSFGFYEYHLRPRFTILARHKNILGIASSWFIMLGDSDGEHIEAMSSIFKQDRLNNKK